MCVVEGLSGCKFEWSRLYFWVVDGLVFENMFDRGVEYKANAIGRTVFYYEENAGHLLLHDVNVTRRTVSIWRKHHEANCFL